MVATAEARRGARVVPLPQSRTLNPDLVRKKFALLEAVGTELFSRYGYHGTSIDQIAAACGMSVGALYRYVRRKEDILLLVFRRMMDLYEAQLGPIAQMPGEPAEKLRQAMKAYYAIIDREPHRALIAYRESWVLSRDRLGYVMQRELDTNRYFEAIIEEGIASGAFAPVDAHLVAYDIVMLGHMWALKGWHFRRRMTVQEYVDRQYEVILAYLRHGGESAPSRLSDAARVADVRGVRST